MEAKIRQLTTAESMETISERMDKLFNCIGQKLDVINLPVGEEQKISCIIEGFDPFFDVMEVNGERKFVACEEEQITNNQIQNITTQEHALADRYRGYRIVSHLIEAKGQERKIKAMEETAGQINEAAVEYLAKPHEQCIAHLASYKNMYQKNNPGFFGRLAEAGSGPKDNMETWRRDIENKLELSSQDVQVAPEREENMDTWRMNLA